MAGQGGGWYAVGRALRDLLLGLATPKTGAARPGSGDADRSAGSSTPAPRRQDPAGYRSTDLESPGQFGEGATRDLTPAEIRGLRPSYAPNADGDPDPGEIVWTWVPYEEHDGRGKDRPVLVIARVDGASVAGCFLTTKQHDGYVSVGTGAWDNQGRESFLAPDRVLRLTDAGMRREGHVLSRDRFARVVDRVAALHGFSA